MISNEKKCIFYYKLIIILVILLLIPLIVIPFLRRKDWYEKYHVIAHGLGGIDGYTRTNSLEAFLKSYDNGIKIYDADVKLTLDGNWVLRHDWEKDDQGTDYKSGLIPSLKEFKNTKIQGKYTPLVLDEFLDIMVEYPDIYVAFDAKENILDVWKNIVKVAKEKKIEQVLDRTIVSFYNYKDYDQLKRIYPFKNFAIRYYSNDKNYDELLQFCKENNIRVVNIMEEQLKDEKGYVSLLENNIEIFVAIENDINEFKKYKEKGINGVVSDEITEKNLLDHFRK